MNSVSSPLAVQYTCKLSLWGRRHPAAASHTHCGSSPCSSHMIVLQFCACSFMRAPAQARMQLHTAVFCALHSCLTFAHSRTLGSAADPILRRTQRAASTMRGVATRSPPPQPPHPPSCDARLEAAHRDAEANEARCAPCPQRAWPLFGRRRTPNDEATTWGRRRPQRVRRLLLPTRAHRSQCASRRGPLSWRGQLDATSQAPS